MLYKALVSTCECGRPAGSIKQVILTSDRQLMLRWHCPRCRRMVQAFKPLSDCRRECPQETKATEAVDYSRYDRRFLASVGVKPLSMKE
jgi:hypothetical protein